MDAVSLDRRIEEAFERIQAMEYPAGQPDDEQATMAQALEELHTLLGELRSLQQDSEGERQRYQDLFELAPDGYLVTDASGIIQEANQAASHILRRRPESLVGKPLAVCVLPEDHAALGKHLGLLNQSAGLEPSGCELRLQPLGSEPFPAALSTAPVRDSQGQLLGIRWLVRDISARKQAEAERLRLAELAHAEGEKMAGYAHRLEVESSILNAIMAHTDTHLVYLDPQFNFVRVNATYARASGYSQEELIGLNHFDLFPHAENQAIFERVRDSGRPALFRATPFVFADRRDLGVTYWDWSLVPVKDAEHAVQGLVLSLADVTGRERARLEREAHLARMQALIEVSEDVLAQSTAEDVVRKATEGVLRLVDSRVAFSGYGYRGGTFEMSLIATHGEPSRILEERLTVEQGGIHLDLLEHQRSIRLTDEALSDHPGQHGLPVGHPPLRGLLGTRLSSPDGSASGLMMVSDRTQGNFTLEDEALLVQLATLTSLALHHIEATAEAEGEAREREATFEAMAEGVVVYDAHAVVVQANTAAAEILGFDPLGQKRADLMRRVQARDRQGRPLAEEAGISARAARGEPATGEQFIITRPQGQQIVATASAMPFSTEGGPSRAVVVFRDVTTEEQAQETLRQYANRLRVLNQMDQAVLAATSVEEMAGAATRFIAEAIPCLRADVALFDFDAQELTLLGVQAGTANQLTEGWSGPLAWAGPLDSLLQGRMYLARDLSCLAPSPVKDALRAQGVGSFVSLPVVAGGDLIGSITLCFAQPTNLTTEDTSMLSEMADQLAVGIQQQRLHQQVQRHAQDLEQEVALRTAQLQASEARFRAIYEGAGVGIALVDTRGRLIATNPALQEMLGCSGGELLGTSLTHFVHIDEVDRTRHALRQLATRQSEGYHRTDLRFRRHDGTTGWANLVLSAVDSAGDDHPYVIAMMEDVTEWRAAQAALIQTEKLSATGRLAASFAHEINNPLQTVIGCLGLARETCTGGGDTARYLAVAHEEVQRAARIVARMRDLNRPVSLEERRPTDLHAILQTVLDLTRQRCEQWGIELGWHPAEGIPPLVLAPDRMQVVFLNLVLNALDAMPQGGRLEVTTRLDGESNRVRVTIADNGVGIDPENLPRIFEAFFTTKEAGVGLGLFITRGIVEDHGGHIEVLSHQGQGTTFTIWLPVWQEKPAEGAWAEVPQ